jgi:hypothetical protein
MNNIILVDDDKSYAGSFIVEAKIENINVSSVQSFDGLKSLLPAHIHKYAGVVLDIKCLIRDNQIKEDSAFIGMALSYIDMNVPGFPRFILTGDETEFAKLKGFYPNERMYLKTPEGQQQLIQELVICVKNSGPLKLKRENTAVFEAFEQGKLDPSIEPILLKILQHGLTETNFANFRGLMGDIRNVLESIYKSINARNKTVIPDTLFRQTDRMVNFNQLMDHLNGYPDAKYKATKTSYQNTTISQSANFVYRSCSEMLHASPGGTYKVSFYTLRSLTNILMELIIWSKQY